MASLFGKNINESYEGLLKTCTSETIASSNVVTDGLGNITALSLGSTSNGSCFDGSLVVGTNLGVCGGLTTDNNLCIKGTSTFNNTIRALGNTLVNGNLTASNFTLNGTGTFNGGITFNNTVAINSAATLVNTTVNGTLGVTGNTTGGGNLTVGGTICSTGDIVAFASSDSRLKDNLIPINSENFVNNLTGYEFDWNDRSKRQGKGKGIIAQDLHKIDETLVRENSEGFLTVDYIGLIPVLIEEVKRLGREIEKLKGS
jgi:hypothetical protein